MKNKPVDPAESAAAKVMGSRGGKNGKGASKRRPDAHYRRLAGVRLANKMARLAKQDGQG